MREAANILMVNADQAKLAVLAYAVERCGYIVNAVTNSADALNASHHFGPNILIIDDSIDNDSKHNGSALELALILKSKPNIDNLHIVVLSDDTEKYKDQPLINDVIKKPFVPSEIIRNLQEFSKNQPTSRQRYLEYENLKMNVGSYRVTKNGEKIHLGPTEFKILQCLMEKPAKVLSRDHIMKYVWGYNSQVEPRTIDVHINRLRTALNNDNEELQFIKTFRAAGYSLSHAIEHKENEYV